MNPRHPKSIDLTRTTVPWIKNLDPRTLPPITARELAIYRSKESGGIDPLVREPHYAKVDPPDVAIEGSYSFVDPNAPQNGPILVKNISRRDAVAETDQGGNDTGRILNKENIEPIIFNLGICAVNSRTEIVRYVFMELHPQNESNPHRDTSRPAAFYREDIKYQGNISRMLTADMGLEAELAVKNMTFKQVLERCASIDPPIASVGRSPGDVQLDLRVFARNNPRQFMMAIRNSKNVVEFLVAEGQDKGHIYFKDDVKAWFFYGAEEPLLETSKVAGNPVAALVSHLNSEKGNDDRLILEQLVGYWR